MQDADPLMAGATIGQTFTTATGTFTEVRRQTCGETTEVQLDRRDLQPGRAPVRLESRLGDTTVLDQTFNDVDLVGQPLTIGNFVSQHQRPAPSSPQPTNTYTPYVRSATMRSATRGQDQIITGQPYQEVLTNFPLGSQILTGLFLNVTLTGAGGLGELPGDARRPIGRTRRAGRDWVASLSIAVSPDAPAHLAARPDDAQHPAGPSIGIIAVIRRRPPCPQSSTSSSSKTPEVSGQDPNPSPLEQQSTDPRHASRSPSARAMYC